MADLFRREVLEHQQHRLYGTIFLAQPLSHTALTALFTVITAGLIAFFCLFGFSRKEVVSGVLVPEHGLLRVYAPQSGLIVERRVSDGQLVAQGDVLFILSTERVSVVKGDTQTAVGASLSTRIARLRTELEQQREQTRQQQIALDKRRSAVQGQMDQIDDEISLQTKRVGLAQAAAQRYVNLQQSQFVSEAQAQDKAAELLDQQSRLRTLQRNRSALLLDITNFDADARDLPLRAEREASAIERTIAELEQSVAENEAQRQLIVRAAQGGRVTGLTVEPGQAIGPTQALATILPKDDVLEAELYAPTRSVGFVRPGAKVLVRYQAFPYQKFGQHEGTIREISRSAIQPNEIALPLSRDPASTEPLYRIRVMLNEQTVHAYGRPEALKAGMQLGASLVLEHRKLYEWVIEPLFSITGRL